MALGFLAVHWTKKVINSIPVVNIVTKPLLSLFPTIVVGPALGAAVVYGLDEGDLFAARYKVHEVVEETSREMGELVRDLHGEMKRSEGPARRLAESVERHVGQMEREVVPVLERQYRSAKQTWDSHWEGGQRDGYGRR